MSVQQQRKLDDDAVRNAFRYSGPFPQRWSFSDEDLEAYLDAEYDASDDDESDESDESAEPYETDPLLSASDRKMFTPSSPDRPIRQHVLDSYYYILEPRQRRRRSPTFDLVEPKYSCLGCIVLTLVVVGITYLGLPVLRALLFPEEQGATSQVQGLT